MWFSGWWHIRKMKKHFKKYHIVNGMCKICGNTGTFYCDDDEVYCFCPIGRMMKKLG